MKPTLFASLLGCLLPHVGYAQQSSTISIDRNRQTITIKKPNSTIVKKIRLEIEGSEGYRSFVEKQGHVINNKEFFILIQQHDSLPNSAGQGMCGAGVETWGYLYQIKTPHLELKNRFLLDSCIKPIQLNMKTTDNDISYNYFSAIQWNNNGFVVHWDTYDRDAKEDEPSQEYSTVFLLNENEVSIESMPTSRYFYLYRNES